MLGRQIYFFSKNNCIISVHTEQTRQLVGFEKYIFKGHFCSPVHVAEKLNYISLSYDKYKFDECKNIMNQISN